MGSADPVLDKGSQYLPGIVVGGIVDLPEDAGTLFLGLTAEGFDPLIYGEKRFFHGSLICPLFCKNRMGNPGSCRRENILGEAGRRMGRTPGSNASALLSRPEFGKARFAVPQRPTLPRNLRSKFAAPQRFSVEASR